MLKSISAIAVCLVLAACGDPLSGIDRISDVDLADDQAAALAIPTEQEMRRTSLFQRLQPDATDAENATPQRPSFWSRLVRPEDRSSEQEGQVSAAIQDAGGATAQPTGLLGRLVGSPDATNTAVIPVAATPEQEITSATPALQPTQRWGLFRRAAPTADPAEDAVRYGDVMSFGTVARVCEARTKPLGRRIEKSRPGGYALYDSDPDSTAPRSFYLTGFPDKCPRQFTAALALLGAPSMHEQLRYGLPGDTHPYSSTDRAYEQVKSKVCKVGRRKPCGAAIKQMDRSTVFVSVYERFEDNARWADILVHDGAVLASAIKTAPE